MLLYDGDLVSALHAIEAHVFRLPSRGACRSRSRKPTSLKLHEGSIRQHIGLIGSSCSDAGLVPMALPSAGRA